jgi:hypothetical protein
MWKRVVRGKTKALFFEAWTELCEEFTDQEAIRWAEHAVCRFLNYG